MKVNFSRIDQKKKETSKSKSMENEGWYERTKVVIEKRYV